jgi:hypothetical protein
MENNQTMKDLTPQEKAKELVEKMNVIHYTKLYGKNKDCKGLPVSMHYDQRKQCALIAVDEMIYYLKIVLGVDKTNYDYYYDVKSEIEKL